MKQWWQKEIGYQIYPRSFKDSNGDGIGDLQGIISKLDYLQDLGVTLIWICPIYASPQEDNGYDISDYYAINPEYGTLEDLEELISEADKRHIKVIMDLVINHTSNQHKWFKDALNNPTSPYRDYYIFKEAVDGHEPNNWRSVFGGSVWQKEEDTNCYYYHSFAPGQPDLNWENPKMRKEIYDMINYWLEKGIAGFRVDAINFIKKDQTYKDGPVDGADGLSHCFPFSRNVKGIEEFFNELKQETFAKHNCMTVAEAVGVPYNELGMFIGEEGCFSMMFDFSYSNFDISESEEWFKRKEWTIKQFKDLLFTSQTEVQKVGWVAPFIENHDQPRAVSKFFAKEDINYHSTTLLANMFFNLRGTPFIYEGQEIGMTNFVRTNINEFDEISSYAQYKRAMEEGYSEEEALHFVNLRSRDNTRTPMHWDTSEYAGFSTSKPWILMNPNYTEINVASQFNDPNSIYSFYKKMINVRKNSEVSDILTYGTFKPIETEDDIIAYSREYNGETVSIYCNFSKETKTIDMKESDVLLNNYETYTTNTLLPYQTILVK